MATVDGITVAKAQEIQDASVVSGAINPSNGHLILTTAGGTDIDAGLVKPPAFTTYPVGSIFMTVSTSSADTLLGGGTWIRWGQGRVPVSQDSTQTEFDVVEETGGEKIHTLTTAEMPSHAHTGNTGNDTPDHGHAGNTNASTGGHEHYTGTYSRSAYGGGGNVARDWDGRLGPDQTSGGGVHGHALTVGGADTRHHHPITAEGGGTAHNNLQPYVVCYMWKRTA